MPTNPLTDMDLDRIQQSIRELNETEEILQRATAAGIDTADQRTRLEATRAQLLRVKQAFFPGR